MATVKRLLMITLLASSAFAVQAQGVYLEPERFVAQHASDATTAKSLWITGKLRTQAEEILQHRPLNLRQRYWQQGTRSVWVMDEIGKEEPITVGFVIEDNKITAAEVLVFRESRGGEIRYPAFTRQFMHAQIDQRHHLDRSIDGISGATLSVNAMRKLARLALTYHRHIQTRTNASAQNTSLHAGDEG